MEAIQTNVVSESHGRSVFSVEINSQGVLIKTLFLGNDGALKDYPAIFPSPDYAFEQIDALRKLVSEKFSEAVRLNGQAATESARIIAQMKKE